MWEELVSLVSTVEFSEEDTLVWQYQYSGIYSSQSLYAVINFGGVKTVYLPVVWKLIVPLRIHFFLWLLSNNKLLTRDNLRKRQNLDDYTCLFCTEKESIHHLFFNCVVARRIWELVSQGISVQVSSDFESMTKLLPLKKISSRDCNEGIKAIGRGVTLMEGRRGSWLLESPLIPTWLHLWSVHPIGSCRTE
jgi:hypothetical protein